MILQRDAKKKSTRKDLINNESIRTFYWTDTKTCQYLNINEKKQNAICLHEK